MLLISSSSIRLKIQWLMQFHGGGDRFLNPVQSSVRQCDAMADSGTAEALAFVHSRKYGVLVHPGQLAGKQFRQFFQHSFLAGQSNKVIARHLDISDGTVKLHVKAILRKLGVHSRVEAAVMAVEKGVCNRSGRE